MSAYVVVRDEKDLKKFAFAIQELGKGRSNAVGVCTLAVSAVSTTVSAMNCGAGSVVLISPTTAHASAEIGNGTIYVSAVAQGSFTLTHANNTQNDRTFGFVCLG